MSPAHVRLEQLNLNLMLALHWLLVEQSVTRAANRMGVTQSAMSRSLGQLRGLLDDQILVSVGRRLEPTSRAVALRKPLADALDALRTVLDTQGTFEPAKLDGVLRLAATEHAMGAVMQRFLVVLRRVAPGLAVHVEPANAGSFSLLNAGQLDLVVGPKVGPTSRGLWSESLHEEHFVTVLRRGNPAARTKLTLRRFCALEHIVVAPLGGERPSVVSAALTQRGLERRVVARVPYFASAIDIVSKSNMALTLPASLAPRRLAVLHPPLPLPGFVLEALCPARQRHSELLHWAIQLLHAAASSHRA
jgi:DNA-binding transcriptional LysR family regulator